MVYLRYIPLILLLIPNSVQGQKIIPGTSHQMRSGVHVIMKELPVPDSPYVPPAMEREFENPEIESSFKKPQTTEKLNKIPFPAIIERPIITGQTRMQPTGAEIYESPCVSWAGLSQFGGPSGTIPPDVAGAVGFDHVFFSLNDRFRIQDLNGNVLREERQQLGNGFWSALDTTNLFDPKIIYDPYNKRWIHVILTDGGSSGQPQNSAILVAVSDGYDPMGGWSLWRIDADAENDEWFDYPSVGFNRNWLVISGNMFQIGGSSTNARIFAFNINDLYDGGGISYTTFTVSGYNTICPAMTYDPTMNDLWCLTNDDVDNNDLRFFKISGGPANPSLTEESFISISPNWGKGGNDIGPQTGTSTRVNTNDHRVLSVVWRNNALFSVQTVFIPEAQNPPDYCTIQFVISNPGNAQVLQAIRFAADNNNMYAHPCLAVNANGDIIISCSRFSSTTFPSAAVLVRRGGTSTFIETTFKAGTDWYVNLDNATPQRNRWGDYTSAMLDPSDDQSVWVSSEYSLAKGAGNAGQWGTWNAKICSGICNTTVNLNTIQTTGTFRKFEASGDILANSTIQSGAYIKLDAGTRVVLQPGFRAVNGAKLKTIIEGCAGPN